MLEIGTGAGDATLAFARDLGPDFLLITIEPDASVAAAARARFRTAGYAARISVIVGDPARFLHKLRGPFDLIVDNDPDDTASLHARLISMLSPGGVLIRGDRKYSG